MLTVRRRPHFATPTGALPRAAPRAHHGGRLRLWAGRLPRSRQAPPDHRWTRGSTDRKQIESWWTTWPQANVGLVTGAPSKLLVLDVDPRAGGDEALHELEREHGPLPDTSEVLTGEGRHVYFHCAEPVASIDLAPGLEVKSSGRQVVAPPSVHPSGKRYEWEASSHGRRSTRMATKP